MNKSVRRKKAFVKTLYIFLFLVIIMFVFVVFCNWKIEHDTKGYIFDDINQIEPQKTALILGTSKNWQQQPNPYFVYRIEAAKRLYDAGKVNAFVVSGDNSRDDYNEPEDMRNALIAAGVPDSIIYLDYAGFRTLDSVVRMSEIFGQKSFVIVSQEFHNQRAVYIAQHYGLNAIGYNAADLGLNKSYYRTQIREKFARAKVFVDILFNKQPKYLGNQVKIK